MNWNEFRYNLRLERNSHLLRSGNKVRVFVADSNATDHINLEELAQVTQLTLIELTKSTC